MSIFRTATVATLKTGRIPPNCTICPLWLQPHLGCRERVQTHQRGTNDIRGKESECEEGGGWGAGTADPFLERGKVEAETELDDQN